MKAYGDPFFRTNGENVKISEDGKNYLLTGWTNIRKQNFNSPADIFVIKTDTLGELIFSRQFYPAVGDDRSDTPGSIVEKPEGGYAVALSSLSFTNYTQGFVPNKNGILSLDENGNLEKALLYNTGGSHFTCLEKALDEGYILSAFTTMANPTVFQPLIIKTDKEFNSDCNEINVTSDIDTIDHVWSVLDISVAQLSGMNEIPDTTYRSLNVSQAVLCENIPENMADFTFNGGHCLEDETILKTYRPVTSCLSIGILQMEKVQWMNHPFMFSHHQVPTLFN